MSPGVLRISPLAAMVMLGAGPGNIGFRSLPMAQENPVEGFWHGTLQVGVELRVVIHIVRGVDGSFSAAMDSPDQGAFGIPLTAAVVEGDSVTLTAAGIGGEFRGRLSEDGLALRGEWSQSGLVLPLELARSEEAPDPLPRPQEPTQPVPYGSEDVVYENPEGGNRIAGTLTLPAGPGPSPAVVLVSGSGPQDRDQRVFGHRPFLVLADYLTRRGIVVLRYDDRGVGGSTGDRARATTEDFADDAQAGLTYLMGRPEIDAGRVGLIGHSEGALVAPMVANRGVGVAFVVLLAAPGVDGGEILPLQVGALSRAEGEPAEVVEERVAAQRRIVDIVRNTPDDAAAYELLRSALREIADVPEETMDLQIRQLLSPWMRYFIAHDPKPELERLEVPVLAVIGAKDVQVPPDPNLAAVEEALRAGRVSDATVVELEGLNHLLQTAPTGSVSEYARIEETMSPTALELIADWITARVGET